MIFPAPFPEPALANPIVLVNNLEWVSGVGYYHGLDFVIHAPTFSRWKYTSDLPQARHCIQYLYAEQSMYWRAQRLLGILLRVRLNLRPKGLSAYQPGQDDHDSDSLGRSHSGRIVFSYVFYYPRKNPLGSRGPSTR
jgi:hypothetical protein